MEGGLGSHRYPLKVTLTISKSDAALLREWAPSAKSCANDSVKLECGRADRNHTDWKDEDEVACYGVMTRLHLAMLVERILRQVARG